MGMVWGRREDGTLMSPRSVGETAGQGLGCYLGKKTNLSMSRVR